MAVRHRSTGTRVAHSNAEKLSKKNLAGSFSVSVYSLEHLGVGTFLGQEVRGQTPVRYATGCRGTR